MKRTTAAPAELAQHVRDLCEAFHLTVKRDVTSFLMNNVHLSLDTQTGVRVTTLHLAPIVDDHSYIAALHEIGHVLHPSGHLRIEVDTAAGKTAVTPMSPDVEEVLLFEEEVAAWTWAIAQALIWNPAVEMIAREALSSYVSLAVMRKCEVPRIFPTDIRTEQEKK